MPLNRAPMAIPEEIINCRSLAEAHRLDLALFVVFEAASVRIAEALAHHAPRKHIFDAPEEEIAVIEANCAARYADTMAKSGITHHGHQESLSHA